jgi:hypothetical protein
MNQKQKCVTFTTGGKETNHIIKLFTHTNLRMAYRPTN